jgi:cytochrome c5
MRIVGDMGRHQHSAYRGDIMKQTVFLLAASLALGACAAHSGEPKDDAAPATAIDGEQAYAEHCAGCHETGMLGAPREGEPQDWEDRSSLWQAVLMDHAKTGYFDMPARGGKTELPDEVVNAASEYMIEATFPDRLKD